MVAAVTSVTLDASTCPSCGLVAVPPEPIGCERCGTPAVAMAHTTVPSTGAVTAHAVVHHHARPQPPTPFVVVEVALDAGPVVRSLLLDAGPAGVAIGARVTGDADETGGFAFRAVA
jgi:uncharacterized protein